MRKPPPPSNEQWFKRRTAFFVRYCVRLNGTGLRCERGGRQVFDGLTFSVEASEALAVTGPNGSGKSSLLRVIAGLVRLDGGQIKLEGGNPDLTVPEQAHYLGHLDPVKPSLTVAENLAMWADFLGGGTSEEALRRTGLGDLADLPAGYLSAGQRRRLSIARLLAVSRPIWLLDEPTAPLDMRGQEDFVAVMREHVAGGGLIIAATHAPLGLQDAREVKLGLVRISDDKA